MRRWARSSIGIAAVAVGLSAGVGTFTLGYATGGSNLTDDSRACANCRVMEEQIALAHARETPGRRCAVRSEEDPE
jgi:nitrate/TMAO reductase-like tetraheme cytochrome c subunit